MYLERINSPGDLAGLSVTELEALADEIRRQIIVTVGANGGHLASNLGAVELTIALHRVFNIPDEPLFFDVGHQAYTHKLLTGRREIFSTLRQFGGCSGFPTPAESRFDPAAAGHAGTAISLALGAAVARERRNQPGKAIAVVGDGSLTCGISLEALNAAQAAGKHLLVILNDNQMSISPNVGGIARGLNRLISGELYNRFKRAAINFVSSLPSHRKIRRLLHRLEDMVKGALLPPGVMFQELGVRYLGPVNGHSLPDLLRMLERIRDLEGPMILHVLTEKGRGCDFASRDPERYHGVSGFDPESGCLRSGGGDNFSRAFGRAVCRMAELHPKLETVSAAMIRGTGLEEFSRRFPLRCHDVGIAEEHAAAFAAGLAAGGRRPVCAIYATFMQRALDSVYHETVLNNFPVIFALDRAGIVEDGPTHHGIYDLGFLRGLPGLVIMAPADERELEQMLFFAYDLARPVVIRYPRGAGARDARYAGAAVSPLRLGRAQLLTEGPGAVIWAMGPEVDTALAVADELLRRGEAAPTVVNLRFVAPFDVELARSFAPGRLHVTIENHRCVGGLYSTLAENLPGARIIPCGWPDEIIAHGDAAALREKYALTATAIAARIGAAVTPAQP